MVTGLPSASTFSRNLWSKTKDHRLVYHRPIPNPSVVPIELRLPVFARFVENVGKPSLIIPNDTMRSIEEFLAEMCAGFDGEAVRASRVRELLHSVLGVPIKIAVVQGCKTDGSILSGPTYTGMILNVEVKNELGEGGGDPFLQNWIYQAKFWADNRLYLGPHASFTVILSGPNIGVCGAISTKSSVVQEWLTPLLPINVSPVSARSVAVVRVLAALRLSVIELQALATSRISVPEMPCLELSDSSERLEVIEPFQNRAFLFRGKFGENDVVVKISRVYCIEAHQALAREGMAPSIFWHGEIGGWKVTVMELVESDSTQPDVSEMENVLKTLHENGFVHGDARRSNFVWRDSGKAVLVDFDSSGVIGETYYPPFMNPRIGWPGPTGSEILPAHDFEMLSSP